MKADTALIENPRDELAMLRHAAGELVPMLRQRTLTQIERNILAHLTRSIRELREDLATIA